MTCFRSKGAKDENINDNENDKDQDCLSKKNKKKNKDQDFYINGSHKGSVQLIAPTPSAGSGSVRQQSEAPRASVDGSVRQQSEAPRASLDGSVRQQSEAVDGSVRQQSEAPCSSVDTASSPAQADAELIAAGWPSWLVSVSGEAVKGWLPRRVESFDKLEKVGQGTYSRVYKARDQESGKLVAMKKVRFVNMDPESVRFMAREITILRKLDHPNVMKLECIVTSTMSNSLYLVFEYMDHDLSGLAAIPGIEFTEQQIKCYMQQLFCGLEHCHERGVLHRDIKGANLLIDNNGVLKIADFGLATFFEAGQEQPLTSCVVTLWYRAPELLLGATQYGVAVDLWSSGCILAELFAGKSIMPGRTEVEQMHKIFKLCGSPSEEYWQKTELPLATSFKPQRTYKRCVAETFRNVPHSALSLIDRLLAMEPEVRGSATSALGSEFFTTEPAPCCPSDLPKYPPSKERDAKQRNEEAKRKKAETVSVRGTRDVKEVRSPGQSKPGTTCKYDHHGDGAPRKVKLQNDVSHPSSMIHPSAVASWNKEDSTSIENRFQ